MKTKDKIFKAPREIDTFKGKFYDIDVARVKVIDFVNVKVNVTLMRPDEETKGGVPRGASPPTGAEWPAPSSRPGARRPTPTWRLQTPPRGPSAAAQAQLRRLPPRPNADQSD